MMCALNIAGFVLGFVEAFSFLELRRDFGHRWYFPGCGLYLLFRALREC